MTGSQKPVFILGASGCVGRALCAVWPNDFPVLWQYGSAAQAAGPQDVVWDILNTRANDLHDLPALGGIVMLAGVTGADAQGYNTALAQAACDLAQRQGCRVLVASSQAVYGAAPALGQGDLTEDQARAHPSSYGAAKLAMEVAVAEHPHGDACCLRIANVIGCDMLLKTAAKGKVVLDRLAGGSSPRRQYIGAAALVQVTRTLLGYDAPLPAVLNVAQPGAIAMADLLQAADVAFTWQEAPATALAAMTLDLTQLMALVPLPVASPVSLIAAARAAGWRAAV